MRLIHLTDPHLSHLDDVKFTGLRGKRWSGFASWHKNRRKKYLPQVLQQLCAAIKAENADQILVTGDLIQIGLDSEIQQAADWLATLGSPREVMLVPGNHDIYASGSKTRANRLWGEYMHADPEPGGGVEATGHWPSVRHHGPLTVIGLSSAIVTPVFMATGKLDETQLKVLPGLLKQARDAGQLVVVLIHHPPLPGMANRRKSLLNADALQKILKDQPPDMLFYGHLHHNRETLWHGARLYCTAATSSVQNASYRVIDIEDAGGRYKIRMTLKGLSPSGTGLVNLDTTSWEVDKSR